MRTPVGMPVKGASRFTLRAQRIDFRAELFWGESRIEMRTLLPRRKQGAASPSIETLRRRIFSVVAHVSWANKAPEPTSTSVMPRATVSFSELKHRTEVPNQARAMPAVAVAHL
jgi:hypothetical protein